MTTTAEPARTRAQQVHNFYCPDELWQAAQERSARPGEPPLAEVLRDALEAYVARGVSKSTTVTVQLEVTGYPPRVTGVTYG